MSAKGVHPSVQAKHAQQLTRLRSLLEQSAASLQANAAPASAPSLFHGLVGGVGSRRLVDFLSAGAGSGAGLIALWLCQQACQQRGELVVVDPTSTFYPPAALAWGVDANRLLMVSPRRHQEALAATEIALRSPAVGAVWARLEKVDGRAFRRLLLAAQTGEAFGALVRPDVYEPDPSWGDVQLKLEGVASPGEPDRPFLVRATQTRNRHGRAAGEAVLLVDWCAGKINDITAFEDAA